MATRMVANETRKIKAGQTYGQLTAIRQTAAGGRGHPRAERWLFQCSCGKQKEIRPISVRSGHTKGCGCLQLRTTHGGSGTSEFQAWADMKRRCNNPNDQHYKNYGGRGITICLEWQNDFVAFLDYIGPKPSPSYSVDRIDNDLGYQPGNVKWATKKQQANNRRPRKIGLAA